MTVLHAVDRNQADSAEFAAEIAKNNIVWFDGGRQFRLSDTYANTKTHLAINQILANGGVVGGTSAGATIQGEYMVRGLRLAGSVPVGTDANGNEVKANQVVTGGQFNGMGFLRGTVVDQHVTQRGRENDLFQFFFDNDPRPGAERLPGIDTSRLLGIGLDEPVALVVNGDLATVWSEGMTGPGAQVRIFDPTKWPSGVICQTAAQCEVTLLDVGATYSLSARTVL